MRVRGAAAVAGAAFGFLISWGQFLTLTGSATCCSCRTRTCI